MNEAHLASPIKGELGYAYRPQLGSQIHCPMGNQIWGSLGKEDVCPKGPSKVRTLFLVNFYPLSLSHFVTHSGTPKSTSHISDPPIFSRPSTKNPDKSPLYKFSLNCSRGFCQGVFCLEGIARGGFCPSPLPSEYICYNRKLKITLNFVFHMYDKKFISVTSHAPPVTNCHTFSDLLPPRA